MREAIHEGVNFSCALRNYTKDGTMFWNELTINPVRVDGRITQFIGTVHDAT